MSEVTCALPGCKAISDQDLAQPQCGWLFQMGHELPHGWYCPAHVELYGQTKN